MALSRLEPDRDRVEELVTRLKALIELTFLRDPVLNELEFLEINRIREELGEIGLTVTWKIGVEINAENPINSRVVAEVTAWIPKNQTLQ